MRCAEKGSLLHVPRKPFRNTGDVSVRPWISLRGIWRRILLLRRSPGRPPFRSITFTVFSRASSERAWGSLPGVCGWKRPHVSFVFRIGFPLPKWRIVGGFPAPRTLPGPSGNTSAALLRSSENGSARLEPPQARRETISGKRKDMLGGTISRFPKGAISWPCMWK